MSNDPIRTLERLFFRKALTLGFAFLFVLTCGEFLWSADNGGQVAQFMSFGAGARSLAMGRAFFAVADDATSVYANPAGMTTLEKKEVSVGQATLFENTSLFTVSYVHPIKSWAWGFNMTQLSSGGYEKITVEKNSVGEISNLQQGGAFTDEQKGMIFGFGKKVLDTLSIGLSVKYISRTLDTASDTFMTIDGGAITLPMKNNPNYKFAFGVQNVFGIKSSGSQTDDTLPLIVKLGNSYRLLKDRMTIALDVSQNVSRSASEWNLGAEYWIWKYIVLRAGVEGNPGLRQSGFGLGFKVKGMNLDIGERLASSELGEPPINYSLSWKFGKSVLVRREDTARRLIQEGIAAYSQGNFMLGLDRLNNSLDIDPTNNDVRALSGKLGSVVNVMPSSVGEDEVPNIIRKAVLDYLKGDNKSAINSLRYAYLEKDPTNERLLQLLNKLEKESREQVTERVDQRKKGFSYIDQKLYDALQSIYDSKYDKSIILLQEVIDLDPSNIEALKRLGSAFYLIEQKDKAKEIWQRALELDPTDTVIGQYLQQIP